VTIRAAVVRKVKRARLITSVFIESRDDEPIGQNFQEISIIFQNGRAFGYHHQESILSFVGRPESSG
jgi:hypothetical protein